MGRGEGGGGRVLVAATLGLQNQWGMYTNFRNLRIALEPN